MAADRIWDATQQREIEALLHDLRVVARVTYDGQDTVLYEAKQLSLFGDRVLPAEIEVMRVLRTLSEAQRILILREEQNGKRVVIRLRSGATLGVQLTIRPLPRGRSGR